MDDQIKLQTHFYLNQIRSLLYSFDYCTKYYLLHNMVSNGENIEYLMNKIPINDTYGEEIVNLYYDELTNLHVYETTFGNQIIEYR